MEAQSITESVRQMLLDEERRSRLTAAELEAEDRAIAAVVVAEAMRRERDSRWVRR